VSKLPAENASMLHRVLSGLGFAAALAMCAYLLTLNISGRSTGGDTSATLRSEPAQRQERPAARLQPVPGPKVEPVAVNFAR
jgi:hypothetical protein